MVIDMDNAFRTNTQEAIRASLLQAYGKVGLFSPGLVLGMLKQYAIAASNEQLRDIENLEVVKQAMTPKLTKEDFLRELRREK